MNPETAATETALPPVVSGRLERWQERLLDLSLRNPLLNQRGKTCLPIVCPDPGVLEDKLARGNKIKIVSFQTEQPDLPRSETDEHAPLERFDLSALEEFAREQMAGRQSAVVVNMDEAELRKRETSIYRKARTALQEGGIGTLYLAFGILEWRREGETSTRRAPLILMPVFLERKSVKDGVRIIASDEETRVNSTLLEMLSKDFGVSIPALGGELPEDEHGVDVRAIWDMFRDAIRHLEGFVVKEDVLLGNFSFAKYLMWADLASRSEILSGSNGVVDHLMRTPNEAYDGGEPVEPETLDEKFETKDLLMPLEADASQTSAVAAADAGNDFILVGPPGTGKSQTISNIIAHMIGEGKTVLFVAEKLAALEVVHRRLTEIGLGQFCLELHSNKTSKKAFLEKLKTASEQPAGSRSDVWERAGKDLQKKRAELNMFVEALHRRRRNGYSAFEGMGYKVKHQNLDMGIQMLWPTSEEHEKGELENLRRIAGDLSAVGDSLDFGCWAATAVKTAEWSPSWEKDITAAAERLAEAAEQCMRHAEAVFARIGIKEEQDFSSAKLERLSDLCEILGQEGADKACDMLEGENSVLPENLLFAAEVVRDYRQTEERLGGKYPRFGWRQLDIDDLSARLAEASGSWWLLRKTKTKAIAKKLQAAASGKPNPEVDVPALAEMAKADTIIEEHGTELAEKIDIWKAHDSDPQALSALAELTEKIAGAASLLAEKADLGSVRERIDSLEEEGFADCERFRESYAALKPADAEFASLSGASLTDTLREREDMLSAVKEAALYVSENSRSLKDWCRWNHTAREAEHAGLASLVAAAAKKTIPAAKLPEAFEASYWQWWTSALVEEDPHLRNFSSRLKENDIRDFRSLDNEYQKATAGHIASLIADSIERSVETHSREWGELRRYMNQKRPRITIRELMRRFPSAIKAVTPCWMMSPLSVSQYLPADKDCFDVVIFDEASQITTWDAIGTLARGKQVIVAGDSKQMPPTNFFQRQDETEEELGEDEENLADMESILDEMETARIPKQHLNFHYRSKKEDLIAFSNSRYYENSLITFPPASKAKGVSLVKAGGTYTPGAKARTNRSEADQIVAEILSRLFHEDMSVRSQTIGVVTFNRSQQQLIEDLLDNERRNNPAIEGAFSEDATEPIFVKNLESVQGDERDVILFSVAYGPDAAGNPPAMRFGPLNREGGQRRLNVAFTRARQEMKIFSSMPADSMRVKPDTPQGVKDLKMFLQYAEHGERVLPAEIHGSLGGTESPLEEEIVAALTQKGWKLESQIGVSRYRIDIGVIHPDRPGEYLAGVECDGAAYHSSYTAKERDKLRQQVLESLGWTLFRIWSTDWWHDSETAAEETHQKLLEHLAESRES